MADYEYHRIKVLSEKLGAAGVAAPVVEQIMEGGDQVRGTAKPEAKAAWLAGAMVRMDQLLDRDTRHAVRIACACCLGGKRLQVSKSIARQHATLDERIAAANEATFVFGHSVTRLDDRRVRVQFSPDGLPRYACSCLPKASETLSITYCYCCGGHVKHHLQTALGRNADVEVVSSALSSGGKRPCTFVPTLKEDI